MVNELVVIMGVDPLRGEVIGGAARFGGTARIKNPPWREKMGGAESVCSRECSVIVAARCGAWGGWWWLCVCVRRRVYSFLV